MLSKYKSYVRGRRSNPVDFSCGDAVFVDFFFWCCVFSAAHAPSLSALFDMRCVYIYSF